MKPAPSDTIERRKKFAFILAILSIVVFIVGLLFNYVFGAAAILGAYGLVIGIRTKTTVIIIIGSIGVLLNFGLYTLTLLSR